MGPPYSTAATPNGLVMTWSYADLTGSKAVSVTMRDGRVVSAPPIPSSYQ